MSRIHEALKKAAEERSAQVVGRSVSDLVDLSQKEELATTESPSQSSTAAPPPRKSLATGQVTQFAEFASHCRNVAWKIEPGARVCCSQLEHQTAAGTFRTLR